MLPQPTSEQYHMFIMTPQKIEMSFASQGPVGQEKSNGPSAGSWGTPLLSY